MLQRFVKIVISSLLALLLLSGCDLNSTSKTTAGFKDFSLESVDVGLIGEAKEKHLLELAQKKGVEETNTILDALDEIQTVTMGLENEATPVTLTAGKFYNFKLSFKTTETYSDGLSFSVTLVSAEESNSSYAFSKILNHGQISDLNTTGVHSLHISTLIPTEVNDGKYLCVVQVLHADFNEIISREKNITEIPEMGGFYVNVEHSSSSHRLELLKLDGEKYLDLPYTGEFNNGYSSHELGDISLAISNSSHTEENLTLSAKLELSTGQSIDLALLDAEDGTIKETVTYVIKTHNGSDFATGDVDIHYYIPESEYASLLNLLPDLSVDTESDGLKGNIVITAIHDKNTFVTNSIEHALILSKVEGDFSHSPSNSVVSKTQNKSSVDEGVLFNYAGKIDQHKGVNYLMAVDFKSDYNIQGNWAVPGVLAKSELTLDFYLFNTNHSVINSNAMAITSLNKQYLKSANDTTMVGNKVTVGAKLMVSVFDSTIINTDNTESLEIISTINSSSNVSDDITSSSTIVADKSITMPQYQWEEEKVLNSQTFGVGPVSLAIEGGIKGSLSLNTALAFNGLGVTLTANSPISLAGFGRGSGSAVIAKAEVTGDVDVIEAEANASLQLALTSNSENKPVFNVLSKVPVEIKLLKADLNVDIEVAKIECKHWYNPFSCSTDFVHESTYALQYTSSWLFNRSWMMLDKDIDLITFPSE